MFFCSTTSSGPPGADFGAAVVGGAVRASRDLKAQRLAGPAAKALMHGPLQRIIHFLSDENPFQISGPSFEKCCRKFFCATTSSGPPGAYFGAAVVGGAVRASKGPQGQKAGRASGQRTGARTRWVHTTFFFSWAGLLEVFGHQMTKKKVFFWNFFFGKFLGWSRFLDPTCPPSKIL